MRLFEFSALVNVSCVIAAESEHVAEQRMRSFGAEALVHGTGDVGSVSDIELLDSRDPKSDDLMDEAHDIVAPKNGA